MSLSELRTKCAEENGDYEIADFVWELYQNGCGSCELTNENNPHTVMQDYGLTEEQADLIEYLLMELEYETKM